MGSIQLLSGGGGVSGLRHSGGQGECFPQVNPPPPPAVASYCFLQSAVNLSASIYGRLLRAVHHGSESYGGGGGTGGAMLGPDRKRLSRASPRGGLGGRRASGRGMVRTLPLLTWRPAPIGASVRPVWRSCGSADLRSQHACWGPSCCPVLAPRRGGPLAPLCTSAPPFAPPPPHSTG